MMLLGAVVFLACWPALESDFLADDFAHVQLFYRLSLAQFLKLFTTDFSQGIWKANFTELRPLAALFYRVPFLAFGTNPVGYHALDITVHIVNTCLVFRIVSLLLSNGAAVATTAALLFGLAPVHAEAIGWISGARADSYPSFFYLLSVYAFVRFAKESHPVNYLIAWLSFVAGLLSKEILVTLPVLLFAYTFFFSPKIEPQFWTRCRQTLVCAPFLITTLGYFWWRWLVFGTLTKEENFGWTQITKLFLEQDINLLNLLFPLKLTEQGMRLIVVGALMGVLLAATLVWRKVSHRGSSVALGFGVLWYLLTQAPLAFTYPSERHLYLPSIGFYIALAAWLIPDAAEIGRRRLHVAGVFCWIALFGATLFQQTKAWGGVGEFSRGMRQGLPRLKTEVPAGSWVIVTAPDSIDRKYAWSWALPFVLQPPFTQENFYLSLNILESPLLYCCPVQGWWSRQRQQLARLLSPELPDSLELYSYRWDAQSKKLELQRIPLSLRDLNTRLQTRMKHPLAQAVVPGWGTARLIWDSLEIPLRFPNANRSFLTRDLTQAFLEGQSRLHVKQGNGQNASDLKSSFQFQSSSGGEERPAIVIPSNSRLSFSVALPPNTWLRFGIALVDDPVDPVDAQVAFRESNGTEHLIFFQRLHPQGLQADRFWQDCQVNLASFGNQAGEIILEARQTRPERSVPVRSGWSGLEIVRVD